MGQAEMEDPNNEKKLILPHSSIINCLNLCMTEEQKC